ncbi:unnamed protein product [Vitrella brassicaformis CCMP3155]|uniref:Septum formation protein Maf n=2 Tax=Vitrella brassicaformis TaxID=1169539 RepID=A0A0G4GLH8_VITBC|nr:unnamed protein product [Vitrella brassicaformis CCMP3155]|mmetsp:Transcript_22740/g.56122  ORF Transcript_22740/g.56122 Transcript_22740/m.56122 type:complete len:296 (+) Transcript_22740:90-977(+)|eukprot:CEM30933.1 unnamed protein product [Vitrella brassicaformis CCMP3155]
MRFGHGASVSPSAALLNLLALSCLALRCEAFSSSSSTLRLSLRRRQFFSASTMDKTNGESRSSSLSATSTSILGSCFYPSAGDCLRVILASKSPRRKEICGLMGLDVTVYPSTFAEDLDHGAFSSPQSYAAANAAHKAAEVARGALGAGGDDESSTCPPAADVVIGADTIVDLDGVILEKPANHDDAVSMLSRMSGRCHAVHTGVAIFTRRAGPAEPVAHFVESTKVKFAPLSRSEIDSYVASGEPMDKAGGYGIQGLGGMFVESIEGCYFNVMGLPMHHLSKVLAQLDANRQIV